MNIRFHSDDTKQLVRTMWLNGETQAAIASQANISRNSVHGIVRRMGVVRRKEDRAKPEHRKVYKLPTFTGGPDPIGPIGTFPDTGCKYIVGDVTPAFQCCGHPQHKGSWCEFHAGRVFTQARIA